MDETEKELIRRYDNNANIVAQQRQEITGYTKEEIKIVPKHKMVALKFIYNLPDFQLKAKKTRRSSCPVLGEYFQ